MIKSILLPVWIRRAQVRRIARSRWNFVKAKRQAQTDFEINLWVIGIRLFANR